MSSAAGQQLFRGSTRELGLATGRAEDSWQIGDAGCLAGDAKGVRTKGYAREIFYGKVVERLTKSA